MVQKRPLQKQAELMILVWKRVVVSLSLCCCQLFSVIFSQIRGSGWLHEWLWMSSSFSGAHTWWSREQCPGAESCPQEQRAVLAGWVCWDPAPGAAWQCPAAGAPGRAGVPCWEQQLRVWDTTARTCCRNKVFCYLVQPARGYLPGTCVGAGQNSGIFSVFG